MREVDLGAPVALDGCLLETGLEERFGAQELRFGMLVLWLDWRKEGGGRTISPQ